MTTTTMPDAATATVDQPQTIEKVSIVISKGSLEGIYPGLIMANGARMEGIDANVFFTFFGMDAITKKRMHNIKVATVGNPGLHMPTLRSAVELRGRFEDGVYRVELENVGAGHSFPTDERSREIRRGGLGCWAMPPR